MWGKKVGISSVDSAVYGGGGAEGFYAQAETSRWAVGGFLGREEVRLTGGVGWGGGGFREGRYYGTPIPPSYSSFLLLRLLAAAVPPNIHLAHLLRLKGSSQVVQPVRL